MRWKRTFRIVIYDIIYKMMDISVYRRKNNTPSALNLLREFYYDYARTCSKKERALTRENCEKVKKNCAQEFSNYVNAITPRAVMPKSPRTDISDSDAHIIRPSLSSKCISFFYLSRRPSKILQGSLFHHTSILSTP
jgi:hypothetical protein